MMSYEDFISHKNVVFQNSGFDVSIDDINPMCFDFQKDIIRWALAKGRCAIFADCGLGKTLMQLEWADKETLTGYWDMSLADMSKAKSEIEFDIIDRYFTENADRYEEI